MFNLKKIALVGVAGLAAFSMSCSDSDGTDPGGVFDPAFSVSLDSDGFIALAGTIKATQPSGVDALTAGANSVTAVSVTANGKATNAAFVAGDTVKSVVLDGTALTGVCTLLSATASVEVKVEVTAKFKDGADLVGSGKATLDCGNPHVAIPIDPISITLSNAGSSYGDLDDGKIYKQADVAVKTTAAKIDLIAYATAFTNTADKIITPGGVDDDATLKNTFQNFVDDGSGEYILDPAYGEGYNPWGIVGWQIPAAGATIIGQAIAANDWSVLTSFTDMIESVTGKDVEYEFSSAAGSAFIVKTTKQDLYAVYVGNKGVQLVDLKAFTLPDEE